MREILFRGKCKRGYDYSDGDGWVYGGIVTDGKECGIVKHEYVEFATNCDDANDWGFIPVEKETVGQFTGHTDIKGNKIFEGDILSAEYHNEPIVVAWEVFDTEQGFNLMLDFDMEVIGNIHDNPELLKGGPQ